MKVKVVRFGASDIKSVEKRLNEELLGWNITKIVKIDMIECITGWRVILIGEVDAS
jgi:hypothetical protein